MPDDITVTRVVEFTGGEVEVILHKLDEEHVQVTSWKRRWTPGSGPYARREEEEGRKYRIATLGLGVSSWEELENRK